MDSFMVQVSYKGQQYPVPIHPSSPVDGVLDFIEEVSPFEREYVKLVYKGKRLEEGVALQGYGVGPDSKLMMLASTSAEVEQIRKARADPLVKGFADEARDEKRRRKRAKQLAQSDWGTEQHAEYRFTRFETLMKYTSPTPYDAEKLLRRFATDPGIIDIMTKRSWQVGTLCEMDPIDDDEQKRRRAEDPNVDVLGWNQNFGQRIALRIRTDDLKGFRTYNSVINTLLHELAHNVFGPHDQNFWNLYAELKKQYMDFHSFWSQNGKKTGTQMGEFDEDDSDQEVQTHVLGGETTALGPREAAALAAERRFGDIAKPHGEACGCGCRKKDEGTATTASPALSPTAGRSSSEGAGEYTAGPAAPAAGAAAAQGPERVEPAPAAATSEPVGAGVAEAAPSVGVDTASEAAPGAGDAAAAEAGSGEADGLQSDPLPEAEASAGSASPDEKVDAGQAESSGAASGPMMDETLGVDLETMEAMGMDGLAAYLGRLRPHLLEITPLARGPAGRAALEVLRKLVTNVIDNPSTPSYRSVKLDNPAIARKVAALPPAVAALKQMGFVELGATLVMEDGRLDVVRLRMGRDLIEAALLRG